MDLIFEKCLYQYRCTFTHTWQYLIAMSSIYLPLTYYLSRHSISCLQEYFLFQEWSVLVKVFQLYLQLLWEFLWYTLLWRNEWIFQLSYGLFLDINKPSLPTPFLSCFCVYFSLHGPFNCISFHKFSWQLSIFSHCPSSLISTLLVISTIYLFMKVSFSPDIIPSG